MADITPGTLPLTTDYDAKLSDFTLRDLLDIVSKIIQDNEEQNNFIDKGEVTASNMLTVLGDISLSPRAIQTLMDYGL